MSSISLQGFWQTGGHGYRYSVALLSFTLGAVHKVRHVIFFQSWPLPPSVTLCHTSRTVREEDWCKYKCSLHVLHSDIITFIPDISIALLSVHYYSEALPITALIGLLYHTPERYRQLRVKDLPKVLTWRLVRYSNLRPSGRKAPNLPLSLHSSHLSRLCFSLSELAGCDPLPFASGLRSTWPSNAQGTLADGASKPSFNQFERACT